MCIAIYKPAGKLLTEEVLRQCFRSNPDGAGFSYVNNEKLNTLKGFFAFDTFFEAWSQIETKQAILHFRIKTHGSVKEDNCHPFEIVPGYNFIHNGIISGYNSANSDRTDTAQFNEEYLQPLAKRYGTSILYHPSTKALIEDRIGYSKFCLLDKWGNHAIFNEDKGNTNDDGVWFSNTSWKKPVVFPKQSNYLDVLPFTQKFQSKPSIIISDIEEGDLLILDYPHYDEAAKITFPKDTIVEVVAINQKYWTVDVISENREDFIYNLPIRKVTNLMGVHPEDKEPDLFFGYNKLDSYI